MRPGDRNTEIWTCPTCRASVGTPYCPTCGERAVRPRDLALRGILHQAFNAASNIDGRLLRSLRAVLSRPGALTVAYVEGPRKPYIGPFQLFLLANVAFVAAQSLTGMNVFSSPLDSHLNHQDWSALAQRLTAMRLHSGHLSLEAFASDFNRTVAILAKSLVIVMAIPFALLLPVLFLRNRKPFGVHVVFAVHVYTFLLLLFCAALLVAAVDLRCGGAGLESARMDTVISALNLAACVAYLYAAIGRVYGTTGAARIVTSLILGIAVAGIALAYRFGLFLLALYVI
jgi:hypothetical protein